MSADDVKSAKVKAALKKLERAHKRQVEQDSRSSVTRLMQPVLIHCASATAARKLDKAIEQAFVDWNEVRISTPREVIAVAEACRVADPSGLAFELQKTLSAVFLQFNIVNFEFGRLDETQFRQETAPEPGAAAAPEGAEGPSLREEGLPPHTQYAGFLDGERLMKETSTLPLKLIQSKNSDKIFNSVWENPLRAPTLAVCAVALGQGLLPAGHTAGDLIGMLRSVLTPAEQLEFARYAIAAYEHKPQSYERFFKDIAETPPEPEQETPFSVTLGLATEGSKVRKSAEPAMPRSQDIGRPGKHATLKLETAASARVRKGAAAGSEKSRRAPVSAAKSARKAAASARVKTSKKGR